MTIEDLQASLTQAAPPASLPPLLQALWFERRGDWTHAHEIAQDIESSDGAWVHAYLHRREGDLSNAGYWYRRAGRSVESGALDKEWLTIAADLLGRG
jgi:hypothetical protein